MSEFRKYGTNPDLDEAVDSEDWVDREAAAYLQYGLEKLINDKNPTVREAVANQGYGLDILVNDKDERVRETVAKQGYGLDILIHDPDWFVRMEVARQGYGLDKLINDSDSSIRQIVAEQGYGLDTLINDCSTTVQCTVKNYLKKNGYRSIRKWAKANPDKVHGEQKSLVDDIRDFILALNRSSKLKIQSSSDVDDFFSQSISEDDIEDLVVCAADTKMPIFRIQKTEYDGKTHFKLIATIATEYDDSFTINEEIDSKGKLDTKVREIADFLFDQQEFSQYADELFNCL